MMLLRRVTRHVRSQNWFAVGVDFLIVVVGVFVGLQVQDWNDARKERAEERALLGRLLTETRELLDAHAIALNELKARSAVLVGVNPVLFSITPARPITPLECQVITASHVNRRPSDELPVLDEMLETGRFGLLRDPQIKQQLRSYVLLRERARAHYNEIVNELFRLHSRYPSLITFSLVPSTSVDDLRQGELSADGFRWLRECDVDGMRASAPFLNEYVDNLSRINSVTGYVAERMEHLTRLEELLADRIN